MEIVAAILFFGSLVGIVGLFVLKRAEVLSGRTYQLAWRSRADERAQALKQELMHARTYADQVLPFVVQATRHMIHESALGFAALARSLERNAYRLADMVSHKHRFEVRAPRSEFLKQVINHKNGIEHGISRETTIE